MNKNIQKLKALTLFVSALFFLSSCQKSTHKQTVNANSPLFLVQAKLVDLPVPLGFTLIESKSGIIEDEGKIVFYYQGDLGIKRTTTFYQKEMEINGWEIQDFSTEHEGLLFCRKANKSCALTIRPHTSVRIVLEHRHRIAKKSTDGDVINSKQVLQL